MFGAVMFNKNSGKVVKVATNEYGSAMLKLWALQNTTKTRACVVVDTNERQILSVCIGSEGFPEVYKDKTLKDCPIEFDIDELCNIIN